MHEMIKQAMCYARGAHSTQKYDEFPYFKHLENTYNILIEHGFTEDSPEDLHILVAAWLHDVLEDTATSYSDLKKMFGIEVAEIVFCVTDELARNRKERKQKTYPKIRSNSKAVIIKVADRIANIKHSKEQNNISFIEMYQKEFDDFQRELRIYKHIDEMWSQLTNLLKIKN